MDNEPNSGALDEAMQPPTPEPTAGPRPINLTFRDQQGNELNFKLKTTTKLKRAMDSFYDRTGRAQGTLKFFIDGERVLGESTPESLDMTDGDVVDAFIEQLGGGSAA